MKTPSRERISVKWSSRVSNQTPTSNEAEPNQRDSRGRITFGIGSAASSRAHDSRPTRAPVKHLARPIGVHGPNLIHLMRSLKSSVNGHFLFAHSSSEPDSGSFTQIYNHHNYLRPNSGRPPTYRPRASAARSLSAGPPAVSRPPPPPPFSAKCRARHGFERRNI